MFDVVKYTLQHSIGLGTIKKNNATLYDIFIIFYAHQINYFIINNLKDFNKTMYKNLKSLCNGLNLFLT